jgi:Heterokaryon incompatibility protein (HET)
MSTPDEPEPEQYNLPELELVNVTPQNKQRLFQNAIETSEKSIEKRQALLARLEQFDPAIAQKFGLKNVAVSEAPFRLLRDIPNRRKAINGLKKIFGRFETKKGRARFTSTNSSRSYATFDSFIALSYCWHNSGWTPAPGCGRLDGCPISSMMLDALLGQRISLDEGIWIDACCIDQSNAQEKVQAIGSMDVIYKSARLVVVILEDVYMTSAEAEMLQKLLDKWRGKKNVPTMSRGFPQLLSSRWFTRAWCSHEVQLGAKSLFLVPTEADFFELDIWAFVNLQLMYPYVYNHISHLSFETLFRSSVYKNTRWSRRSPMAQFNGIMDLNSCFETDKIGIGVNVAGLQLYYTGPDMSIDQCRWLFVILALSAGDLTSLCGTGPGIQISAETNVSSWLRWNDRLEDFIACLSDFTLPEPSHILSIHPEYIHLDLLVLEHYSLRTPSTKSVLIATTFLDRLSEDILDQLHLSAGSPQSEILACSLDCGLAWLMKSMTYSQDIANQMQWYIEGLNFDFWPLVARLLIDAYPSEESTISTLTSEQKRSVSQFIYFTLCTLTPPMSKSQYGSGMFGSQGEDCMWLDWGTPCGKALTFIGVGRAVVLGCHFAVPAALGGPSCTTMDRLWLLKPRGSTAEGEWSIVEKIRLVTVMPLEEDGGNVVLRTAQTIRG